MDRRNFMRQLACAVAAGTPLAGLAQQKNWQQVEAAVGGRLGVAVLDTAAGKAIDGHRLDERFPMCSTFKWLAAAHVLHRADRGLEQLDRRIRYGREVLLPHSPITERHAGQGEGDGMTLAELCEATITISDNAAGNLILQTYGGPEGLTRYARSLGDTVTRLDRWETELNEARPGDPRDTTSPRAMAILLRTLLVGDALSPPARAQLARWMEATRTSGKRLKADLPGGWRVGSKTGTGARGTTNDVGIFRPPGGGAPVLVAVYLTECEAPEDARNAAVARVARHVTHGE